MNQWIMGPADRKTQKLYNFLTQQTVFEGEVDVKTYFFLYCPLTVSVQGKLCIHLHYACVAALHLSVYNQTDWITCRNDCGNQWYHSSCNIIWKMEVWCMYMFYFSILLFYLVDRWPHFIYWMFATANSAWIKLMMRIWSVTIVWELSLALFLGFEHCDM